MNTTNLIGLIQIILILVLWAAVAWALIDALRNR
jgi:hypothetical protein